MSEKLKNEWSACLIEDGGRTGPIRYMTMEQGMFEWTTDPLKALHFCRREDADRVASECEDADKITEHLFLGPEEKATPSHDAEAIDLISKYKMACCNLAKKPMDCEAINKATYLESRLLAMCQRVTMGREELIEQLLNWKGRIYLDGPESVDVAALNKILDAALTSPQPVPVVPEKAGKYDLSEIVREWLIRNGYDGLYVPGECACTIDDLFPCGDACPDCSPGYKVPCNCGDHDYHIDSNKPDKVNGDQFFECGKEG